MNVNVANCYDDPTTKGKVYVNPDKMLNKESETAAQKPSLVQCFAVPVNTQLPLYMLTIPHR